jgi:hypothetical protein
LRVLGLYRCLVDVSFVSNERFRTPQCYVYLRVVWLQTFEAFFRARAKCRVGQNSPLPGREAANFHWRLKFCNSRICRLKFWIRSSATAFFVSNAFSTFSQAVLLLTTSRSRTFHSLRSLSIPRGGMLLQIGRRARPGQSAIPSMRLNLGDREREERRLKIRSAQRSNGRSCRVLMKRESTWLGVGQTRICVPVLAFAHRWRKVKCHCAGLTSYLSN